MCPAQEGRLFINHSATWKSRVKYQESTQVETLNRQETAVPRGTGAEGMEKGRRTLVDAVGTPEAGMWQVVKR